MIPEYKGQGKLTIEDKNHSLIGQFYIKHSLNLADGLRIEFHAADLPNQLVNLLLEDHFKVIHFEGVTEEGKAANAKEALPSSIRIEGASCKMELLPLRAVEIGSKALGKSVRFLIPNLLFAGLESSRYQIQEVEVVVRDRLEFEISFQGKQLSLTLKQLPDYNQAREKLRRETLSEWTSTLTLQQVNQDFLDINFAIECADLFLLLTSLAMGERISWVSAEVLDERGKTLYQYIKRGTAKHRHSLPSSIMGNGELVVIRNNKVESPYKNFIDRAFHSYQSLTKKQQKALRNAIESYCEAVEIRIPPAPLKLTARSFEALIKAFLDEKDLMYSVPSLDLRAKLFDLLKEFIDLLKQHDPNIATEFNERLSGKIENLLRRPFKVTLAKILDKYLVVTGNPYDSSWVREFVNARDDAVHGREMSPKHYEAWLKGNNLLEKLLMKILNYRGPYVERVGLIFNWKNLK